VARRDQSVPSQAVEVGIVGRPADHDLLGIHPVAEADLQLRRLQVTRLRETQELQLLPDQPGIVLVLQVVFLLLGGGEGIGALVVVGRPGVEDVTLLSITEAQPDSSRLAAARRG
jgi:hypothetical protein